MARYTAIVDGEKSAYGVVFPDLPGCTGMGDTVEGALRSAIGAMREWIENTVAHGETVPEPRAIEELYRDPEVRQAIADGGILMTAIRCNLHVVIVVLTDNDLALIRIKQEKKGFPDLRHACPRQRRNRRQQHLRRARPHRPERRPIPRRAQMGLRRKRSRHR